MARGSFDYKIDLKTGDEMQGLAEAFNDMTARLSVTYADLERQVQERSRQLVRSERLAGVGFLAAGVAHEINNPLASIAFCSEALENRLDADPRRPATPADAKVVRNYLRMIQEEAFRCKSITEKLLDFSRCGEIQRERTDLAGLIQGVVEMVRHMGKYRGKTIVFQPREAVMAHVDGQEIKQVVLNLVVNALDSHGGRRDARGSTLRHAEGMAEMVFADNGCGMTARGPGEHLRAVLHPAPGRQGDRPGPVDHPPDRQPAPRRDHRDEPRRGPGADVHRPAARSASPRTTPTGGPSRRARAAGRQDGRGRSARRLGPDLRRHRHQTVRPRSARHSRDRVESHGGDEIAWRRPTRAACGSCSPTTRRTSAT